MARRPPSVVEQTLCIGEGENHRTVVLGTTAWFAWLADAPAFRFVSAGVTISVQRQQRRGRWYWYAFKRTKGTLHCRYVGSPSAVTYERLVTVARQFQGVQSEATVTSLAAVQERLQELIALAETQRRPSRATVAALADLAAQTIALLEAERTQRAHAMEALRQRVDTLVAAGALAKITPWHEGASGEVY